MSEQIGETVDFDSEYEKRRSRCVIKEGEFKVVCERIYPLNEKDDVGLPRFKCSHNTVIRVLPPKDEVKK